MKKIFVIILIQLVSLLSVEAIEVPYEIQFAGMELKLSSEVRKKLQADIEMITRSQKAFQTKVDRADLYFPIIERIFKEESLPDDFKFLALQESSLISDAISTSNAVGYWQFKKETAVEVGMRVDYLVDERMNIVSSSRGAAKYLKKNNTVYFNNWVYALLSYNLGAGGTKSKIKEKYLGATKMVIEDDMHWYVIRFLAHKIAYEHAVGKNFTQPLILVAYDNCENKSLHELSAETKVDVPSLETYNKWLLKGKVPDDKDYFVILPVNSADKAAILANNSTTIKSETKTAKPKTRKDEGEVRIRIERKGKRREFALSGSSDVALVFSINGIKAIRAKEGDNLSKLALQGGVSLDDFLRYNDMKSFEQAKPGECYYLQPKRNKGLVMFHTAQPGESLKDVSQKYGMRIEAIRSKNRMGKGESLQTGRVLWLRKKRPVDIPVEIKKIETPVIVPKEKAISPVIKKDTQQVVLPKDENLVEPVNEIMPDTVGEKEGEFHYVKQGETLYSISKMYVVSLDSLKTWNGLSSNEIKLGQKLLVNKKSTEVKFPGEHQLEHIIQQGETLYQISRKYGVSIESLQLWNNKADTKVSLGEKLIIKK